MAIVQDCVLRVLVAVRANVKAVKVVAKMGVKIHVVTNVGKAVKAVVMRCVKVIALLDVRELAIMFVEVHV